MHYLQKGIKKQDLTKGKVGNPYLPGLVPKLITAFNTNEYTGILITSLIITAKRKGKYLLSFNRRLVIWYIHQLFQNH